MVARALFCNVGGDGVDDDERGGRAAGRATHTSSRDTGSTNIGRQGQWSEDGTEEEKRTKDDDGDVDAAEDAELVRFLEEPVLALCRR